MSNLPDDWKEYPLNELYDFRSGLSKPRSEFGFGYGFLSFKDVFYNFFVPDKLSELVNSTEQERQSCSIKKGDVFLTRTSETMDELGMSCIALKDYEGATFNGFTKRLRPKINISIIPEYAGYFFRSPKFRYEVTAMSSLCTRASLNNEMLGRLKIILPSIEEQSAIGYILKSLDDKIELNQQMNQTLEAIARAIFKSWFVDFDPVRAKMAGKQPVGMDAATANLFPDSFEESALGLIPKGWKVGTFANLAEINKGDIVDGPFGSNLKSSDYTETGTRLIHQENIQEFRFIDDKKRFTFYEKAETLQRSVAYPNDIVLTKMPAPITRATIIPKGIADKFIIMADCIRVRPYQDITPNTYLLYLINNPLFRQEALSRATGTTRPRINLTQVKSIQVIIPPVSARLAFNKLVEPLEKKREAVYHESRTLANIRDTLLPKLMSGEIRVKEAETIIKEVN